MDSLSGYRGVSLRKLIDAGVEIGDLIELELQNNYSLRGFLVPRYQYNDEEHIVLKLKSGYNMGLDTRTIRSIVRIGTGERPAFLTPALPKMKEGLPRVTILGTGGTIASRVDYRTGAVNPATTAEELYALFPELADIARIEPEIMLSISSENMEPEHWGRMAERVSKAVDAGVSGVIVTHGTDTLGYTAAALSFALQGVPIPVILVGAQRSPDRPSSDAYLNMIGAVTLAANEDFSGVYVAMHADESDREIAVHIGTRVRKNHTSARAAFESIGTRPIVRWSRSGEYAGNGEHHHALPRRGSLEAFRPRPNFESRVALLKFYPSMPSSTVEGAIKSGVRGLVLEGTGLGHVAKKLIPALQEFISTGGVVCMTSQCIWGRVDMNVYDMGRDLLSAGVLPLGDMLAETALAKLMWSLANTSSPDEAKRVMLSNLAGEVTARTEQREEGR